jgi:hypothetical protein
VIAPSASRVLVSRRDSAAPRSPRAAIANVRVLVQVHLAQIDAICCGSPPRR